MELPPSLIRLCRGGKVPKVISSGPDMLVVFHSSPFSTPSSSPFSMSGFELDVNIEFVDINVGGVVPRDKTTGTGNTANKNIS